jgi:asparagine synthase (glutamine-hydrolysing)
VCGLAGAVGGADVAEVAAMGRALRHRGPDGEGLLAWSEGPLKPTRPLDRAPAGEERVALAHLRLSVIDLGEANAQPMLAHEAGLALAYNGELYNYVELRAELERLGHGFTTKGDTEVLLRAWEEWGPSSLERMVGMWAFALLDTRRRRLHLVRDRFGIKPMFWLRRGGAVLFASELKAFRAASLSLEPDAVTLRRFLDLGVTDDRNTTFLSGVERVPAATVLSFDLDGNLAGCTRYWEPAAVDFGGTFQDATERFAELFEEAVHQHARADVRIGSCLSGGIDSSSVVCVADRLRRAGRIPVEVQEVVTYVSGDSATSEERWAEMVLDATGVRCHKVSSDLEALSDRVPEVVATQDEPFGSASIVAQGLVFDRARSAGLKVMLDGQGADEVLAGYLGYLPLAATGFLLRGRLAKLIRLERAHRAAFGAPALGMRRALGLLRERTAGMLGRARAIEARLHPSPVLGPALRSAGAPSDLVPSEPADLRETLVAHTLSAGLPALLRFEDRSSMASSIEARVPFLDHRLVDFAFSLPDTFKLGGATTKRVLRAAMRGTVPDPILDRQDKIGFRADPAITVGLIERHRADLVAERSELEREWFDSSGFADTLDRAHESTEAEFAAWRAVNAKLWIRTWWGAGPVLH